MILKTGKFKIEQPHLVRSFLLVGTPVKSQDGVGHHTSRQSILAQVSPLLIKSQSHWIMSSFKHNYLPKVLLPDPIVGLVSPP
jgi:hypothetical protein